MKKLFNTTTSASVALLGLMLPVVHSADVFRPDAAGYIRDWVMLAPIALPEGDSGADSTLKEQIRNEGALRPKAGDKIQMVRGRLVINGQTVEREAAPKITTTDPYGRQTEVPTYKETLPGGVSSRSET